MTLEEIVDGAVGPFNQYCDGYGNPGSSGLGYISVLTLDTGIVKMDMDDLLEEIVAYDRAEASGTYIGQVNMITASSFNGLNGAVFGYDLAKHESIADNSIKPLFMRKRGDGKEIPIYSVEPLLDAGKKLLGTNDARRFPLIPGAHVRCAVKSTTKKGPTTVWSAIALAMAEDQEKDSNLFIEDAGNFNPKDEEERTAYLDNLMENIATSVVRCGDDQNVKYKEIFIGYKAKEVPEGHAGNALVCAPYLVLAKNAIPKNKKASDILNMTVLEWEKEIGL